MSSFHGYFSKIYGARWEPLWAALRGPAPKVTRSCFGNFGEYVMDSASIRAAEALRVVPGDSVLDLCAAPGGKTLVLLEALQGRGELVANELSAARRRRLKQVIEDCVPPEVRERVRITGFDGNRFGLARKENFDRVLLDAPCSSERHCIEQDPEMSLWKESRSRQLALRQYSLVCSAALSLRKGGVLVYSTCSISPLENDGVIGRLLERKGDLIRLDSEVGDLESLERTRYGFQIFPDAAEGAGPIYLSRLIRAD